MKPHLSMLSACLVALLCTSCKIDLGGIDDAATKIRDGMSDLSTGLKEIDPVAAQKLFKENEDLRKQLQTAILKADSYAYPGGYVVLRGTKIKLKIFEYIGKFKINAWNNNEHVLIDYPLVVHPLHLKDLRTDFINEKYKPSVPYNGDYIDFNMRQDSQNYAQWSLEKFVAANGPLTSEDHSDLTLNYTFGGEGLKNIRINIEPLAVDGMQAWSIKGGIIAQYSSGAEDRIDVFGKDGTKFGEQQEAVSFQLYVKDPSPQP